MGEYRYNSEKNPLPDEPKETLTLANDTMLTVAAHYIGSWSSGELPHAVDKDAFKIILWLGDKADGERCLMVADTTYTPSCKAVARDITTSPGVKALMWSAVITRYSEVDKIGEAVERVTAAMNRLLVGLVNT